MTTWLRRWAPALVISLAIVAQVAAMLVATPALISANTPDGWSFAELPPNELSVSTYVPLAAIWAAASTAAGIVAVRFGWSWRVVLGLVGAVLVAHVVPALALLWTLSDFAPPAPYHPTDLLSALGIVLIVCAVVAGVVRRVTRPLRRGAS